MSDICLNKIIDICGNYNQKSGNNYYFRCPICENEGHDKHGDNLVFNSSINVIKCFANETHAPEILRMINKKFKITKPVEKKPRLNVVHQWELNIENYANYMILTNDYLLKNKELLNYLKEKRGFTKETIERLFIGFDNTENCFTIPIISLKYDCITDFELRFKGEKKKIRRVGGGCNTIAVIDWCDKQDTLIICEGFIDGITLSQFMREKNKKDFAIVSCSNGVSSLFNVLPEINFNLFKKIKLILDNDKAGDETTKKIIEKYPFIKDCREFLIKENIKDVNDWYMKGKKYEI